MTSSEFNFLKYFFGGFRIKTSLFCTCFLFSITVFSQTKFTDNLNGMINFHSGFNLPEYPFTSAITEDYIRSIDICLFKESVGKNEWEQLYNYPDNGVSLFYSTLGNDAIMGRELALSYFFTVTLLSKNQFRLFNRVGIGIDYVNRKFNMQNNYLDVAVSSNVNIHFNYGIGTNYTLSEKFKLNLGISFDHLSNANSSQPNLGINYLTAYTGLSYGLGKKTAREKQELKPLIKKNSITLFACVGGKHARALSSNYSLTSSVSLELSRNISRIFHFGVGNDFFFDSSVKSSLEEKGEKYKPSYRFQTGIHSTQSLVYNKITLSLQEGVYLLYPEKVKNYTIYNRGIIQYQLNNHITIRFAMKSHLNILDYPEAGIGYKF